MKYTALIPVKSLAEAKSRLAAHLTQPQRAALMLDMLQHVLCVLRKDTTIAEVAVVSVDQQVLEQAHSWGALALPERQHGHNPALTAAATQLREQGTTALLTISADLPLLEAGDIQAMIELAQHHAVVLAPSQDGTGTNAILVQPPLTLPYLFGPNSLPHYQTEARHRGLTNTLYTSIGLGLDIDTIDDITTLRNYNMSDDQYTLSSCP